MDNRQLALGAVAVGVLLVLVGSLSDVIGFGSDGFGPGQLVLLIVGAASIGYGAWRYSQISKV
ncbi:MAG: hypothetical protein V3S60_00695 [Acidimicrobiia bacterium]|jgi:hypothetical protein